MIFSGPQVYGKVEEEVKANRGLSIERMVELGRVNYAIHFGGFFGEPVSKTRLKLSKHE